MVNLIFISNLFIYMQIWNLKFWQFASTLDNQRLLVFSIHLFDFQFIKFSSHLPCPKGKDGASLEDNWTYVQEPSEKSLLFSLSD